MVDLNNELKDNPFSFSPSLKGKAYWVSNNTIEFVPEEGTLKPGEFYEGTFQLGRFRRSGQQSERIQLLFPGTGTQFHTAYRTTDNHHLDTQRD